MMLKVGDKLVCKTELTCRTYNESSMFIKTGHVYTLTYVSHDLYSVIADNNQPFTFASYKYGWWFISLSDLRKQKLERINDVACRY